MGEFIKPFSLIALIFDKQNFSHAIQMSQKKINRILIRNYLIRGIKLQIYTIHVYMSVRIIIYICIDIKGDQKLNA